MAADRGVALHRSSPSRLFAYLFAIAFLLGGIAIQWPRTARIGAVALGILYGFCALFWLPRVIGFPKMIGAWSGFADELMLVLAAVVVYASLQWRESAWSAGTIRGARILFGLCFVVMGVSPLHGSFVHGGHGSEVDSAGTNLLGNRDRCLSRRRGTRDPLRSDGLAGVAPAYGDDPRIRRVDMAAKPVRYSASPHDVVRQRGEPGHRRSGVDRCRLICPRAKADRTVIDPLEVAISTFALRA